MVLLPSDFKQRKHKIKEWGRAKTGQIAKQGTVEIWEHWDGSRDATVKPKSYHLRLSPERVKPRLIAEVEAAIREHELALKSGNSGWQQRTRQRVDAAMTALKEN